MKPFLIGIAGPSCSGKSRLAGALAVAYADWSPHVLSMDCYYRDLSSLDPHEREKVNFDTPEAIDSTLLVEHLETLSGGGEIAKPRYDFTTHTRSPGTDRVAGCAMVLVEGLFALYWEAVRRLLHSSIFVEIPPDQALLRRLERDMRERGRSRASILHQYTTTVAPMNERHVLPTAAFADLVVSGMEPLEQSLARVRAHLDRFITRD